MSKFNPDYIATGHYARVSFSSPIEVDPQILQDDHPLPQSDTTDPTTDSAEMYNAWQQLIARNQSQDEISSTLQSFTDLSNNFTHLSPTTISTSPQYTNTLPIPQDSTISPHNPDFFSHADILSSIPQFRTYDPLRPHHAHTYLVTAADSVKDQTYFLSAISPEKLSRVIFPVGHFPKHLTRELATALKLPNFDRRDSMGICFVGQKGDFGDFLSQYLSDDQQLPGRMLSVEQYIELMHIHTQSLLDKNGNAVKSQSQTNPRFSEQMPVDVIRSITATSHLSVDTNSQSVFDSAHAHSHDAILDFTPTPSDIAEVVTSNAPFLDSASTTQIKSLKPSQYPKTSENLVPYPPKKLELHFAPHNRDHLGLNVEDDGMVGHLPHWHNIPPYHMTYEHQRDEESVIFTYKTTLTIKNQLLTLKNQFGSISNEISSIIAHRSFKEPEKMPTLLQLNEFNEHLNNLDNCIKSYSTLLTSSSADKLHSQFTKKESIQYLAVAPLSLSYLALTPIISAIYTFIKQMQHFQTDKTHRDDDLSLFYTNTLLTTKFTNSTDPNFLPHFITQSLPLWNDVIDILLKTTNIGVPPNEMDAISPRTTKDLSNILNISVPRHVVDTLQDTYLKAYVAFQTPQQLEFEQATNAQRQQIDLSLSQEKENGEHPTKEERKAKKFQVKSIKRPSPPETSIFHQQLTFFTQLLNNVSPLFFSPLPALSNKQYSSNINGTRKIAISGDYSYSQLLSHHHTFTNNIDLDQDLKTFYSKFFQNDVFSDNTPENHISLSCFDTDNVPSFRSGTTMLVNGHDVEHQNSLGYNLIPASTIDELSALDTNMGISGDLPFSHIPHPAIKHSITTLDKFSKGKNIFSTVQNIGELIHHKVQNLSAWRTKISYMRLPKLVRISTERDVESGRKISLYRPEPGTFAKNWRRAFGQRSRLASHYPLSLISHDCYQDERSIKSSSVQLLAAVAADRIIHHHSYKKYFGLYHKGLTRYTENQRLATGMGHPKETVLSKIPHSNTLLYTTGHLHPFSVKNSCVLNDFTPLSYNPLHFLQIPSQHNTLRTADMSNEAVERLLAYGMDLYSRGKEDFRLWTISNELRMIDELLQNFTKKHKKVKGGLKHAIDSSTDRDEKKPSVKNETEEQAVTRPGPPPVIMDNNIAVFNAYRDLFPFSDFGFLSNKKDDKNCETVKLYPSPIDNLLTELTNKEKLLNPMGYKAYAKIRSTGNLFPCRLVLEDIPYDKYINNTVKRMNPHSIVQWYNKEYTTHHKITNIIKHTLELYTVLHTIDQELINNVYHNHFAFHPLSQPLLKEVLQHFTTANHNSSDEPNQLVKANPQNVNKPYFTTSMLTQSILGKYRLLVHRQIQENETYLHLQYPREYPESNNNSNNCSSLFSSLESTDEQPTHAKNINHYKTKRLFRVMFEHQQQYLSNGQTIAVYIPVNTMLTGLQYHAYLQTQQVRASSAQIDPNTITHDDFEYERNLYSLCGFDLSTQLGDLINTDKKKIPVQPHVIFNNNSHSKVDIARNVTKPSYVDRFICLGSGTIMM